MSFILFMLLVVVYNNNNLVYCQDAQGEKAHFQVHNKEQGMLEIHATKAKATITATADSVQMVVDPGEEKVPEDDIQSNTVKINHVTVADPATSVKKSKINTNKFHHQKHHQPSSKSKRHFSSAAATKPRDATGVKKSHVAEKEMSVHGQSGLLHVHTDHNLTAVHSNSGKLEIYIKNPDHHAADEEAAAKHHSKVSVEVIAEESYGGSSSSKKNQLQRDPRKQLHIIEMTGVKKSILNNNHHRQHIHSRKQKRSFGLVRRNIELRMAKRHHPCAAPPCSN